jgi:hypothetical protein
MEPLAGFSTFSVRNFLVGDICGRDKRDAGVLPTTTEHLLCAYIVFLLFFLLREVRVPRGRGSNSEQWGKLEPKLLFMSTNKIKSF